MAERIRAHAWSSTPLGPIDGWTDRLKLLVEMVLSNPLVAYVVCEPGRVLIYNDAAATVLGPAHPRVLGQPISAPFAEARRVMEPLYDQAFAGRPVQVEAQPADLNGRGWFENFDLVLAPVPEKDGRIRYVQVIACDVSGRLAAEEERNRTLQDLRASEARLRLVLDAARMGVWTYDPATDTFAIDARTAEITGLAAAEALPASAIWAAAHPEDRALLQARLADVLDPQGDHWNEADGRFVHPDGTTRWTQARAHSILEGGAEGWTVRVLGTLLDASDGKQAEIALRESEQRFRAFVAASSDWIYRINSDWSEVRRLDGRGLLPDTPQLVEECLNRHLHPDDRAIARSAGEQAMRSRTMFELEHRLRRADGTIGWAHSRAAPILGDRGEITEWLGTTSDVTARRQAEEALRSSEERLRAVANLGPDFLWSSDPEGRATWFSERWYRYTGQSEAEAFGHGWHDVVHPDDREPAMARFFEVVEQGRVYSHEYRIRARDGSYRWFLVRAGPVYDEVGQLTLCYGAVTDIHDLHQLQEEQSVMVSELQHRTRNLIAVVRSIANHTMARTGPTELFREQFADRLSALSRVQGLLSRSNQEPITIRALVRMELDALGAAAMRDRIALEGPHVTLRKSSVQTLALALHELATNACKYGALAGDQGTLGVKWSTDSFEDGERWLAVTWLEEGICGLREGGAIRRGYGRELIEKALPYALKARTTYEFGERHLRCSIDLPLT